ARPRPAAPTSRPSSVCGRPRTRPGSCARSPTASSRGSPQRPSPRRETGPSRVPGLSLKPAMSPEIRWLFQQVRPFTRLHVVRLLTLLVTSVLALADPLILKWILDELIPWHKG